MKGENLTVKNVEALGGRTTVKLEPAFWTMLQEICGHERTSLNAMIQEIDRLRGETPRASAIRVFVLEYFCSRQEAGDNHLNGDRRARRYDTLPKPIRSAPGERVS